MGSNEKHGHSLRMEATAWPQIFQTIPDGSDRILCLAGFAGCAAALLTSMHQLAGIAINFFVRV